MAGHEVIGAPGPTDAAKTALRSAALVRRDALPAAAREAAALSVAARDLPAPFAPGSIVSGYWPIRSEFDPRPLMRGLAARGARLALPVIVARDAPLLFRAWDAATPLVRGQLGILEPPAACAELQPDVVLVPLAAFDRAGHRLGYGAGHYDRTLAAARRVRPVIAIGLAFAAQEVAQLPAGVHDERLDLVLTERGTIDLRSG